MDPYEQHKEIARTLQYTIEVWAKQRQEALDLAESLRKRISVVRTAVATGQWHLLEDELEQEQIQLLFEIEPDKRMALLDEPWE